MIKSMVWRSGRWLIPAVGIGLAACASGPTEPEKAAEGAKPLAVDLHRDHGWAALQAERYDQAGSYFRRILKERPGDQQAYLGLGEALLGQGRLDDARDQFSRIGDGAPAQLRAKALQGQGIIQLRQGEALAARHFLQQAIQRDDRLWRSWNAIGRLHDAEKNYADARKAYRQAIAINPRAAFLHNNLGFSFLASGEPSYAEVSFTRALELDPGLDVAATNLRLALALQGRYGPALASTGQGDRATVMNNVGYAALLRGDHRRARKLFIDAMAANPGFFGEAKRNLAFLETLETDPTAGP